MSSLAFSDLWFWLILIAVAAYLIGCFNFAVLISRLKHKDVRQMGSGNPGTMNMTREFGLKIGALTLLCDLLKGGLPVLVVYFIFRGYKFEGTNIVVSDFMRYFTGLFVVLGHIYPVTMGFKGGKGIASTIGVIVFGVSTEAWWAFIPILLVYGGSVLAYIALTEWGSMGSLYAISAGMITQAIIFTVRYPGELSSGWMIATMMLLVLFCFFTWFAHRANIMRLLSGEEHHTSVKKLSKGKRGTNSVT